ncbi:helix-turn-helix domain-containing protein [Riemerella anatipestifer]
MAQMLGLTVETVIRTIKKMEKKGLLKILRGKVYY